MQVLGHATTNLPDGFVIIEDMKTEEIETGVASFECKIGFNYKNRALLEKMTEAGNYLLRSNDGENEFYTIIETEIDTKNQEIYVYAEDAGLDLLNEIAPEFEADTSYTAEWYINKYIYDSGFEIGVNEIPASSKLKLVWDGEDTVTGRLASIANSFGGYEISFSFDIKGLEITNKYVNIYKERGKELGEHLRLNRDIDRIITTKSVANLATAFVCEGGTPEREKNAKEDPPPITLKGYKYDDGDFFVSGDKLKSRKANQKWSRYVWNKEPNRLNDDEGYIVRPYSYDTLSQSELCSHAIAELKKVCDMEVNYEIDIGKLPDGVKVGDRINIVDDAGALYVSSRILKLQTSVVDQKHEATLGEHLIKKSGISQKVIELAGQFAQTAKSASKALSVANAAKSNAESALTEVETVVADVEQAQQNANTAMTAANDALSSATDAQTAAEEAKSAVGNVEKSVENLETAVTNAQTAANNAQQAATTAQSKADEAEQAAAEARANAADAKAAVGVAEGKADTAITKADTAQNTADIAKAQATTAEETAQAAKLDAEQAEKDIASLGEQLTTVTNTMEADYARKTDLTKSEAHLQSQISQNAALISSTVSMLSVIDETVNDAQDQAEKAQKRAEEARRQANQATADALAAQTAADEAAQAAVNAQAQADIARAAADTAQSVVDEAEEELAIAQAELEAVLSRSDATEAEIIAAQNVVNAAQAAIDKAKDDAAVAIEMASQAQKSADEAINNAAEAQATANTAANYAKLAQSVANEAENATAAQQVADEAAEVAAEAQRTANTAVTNATNAQAKADQAATEATAAQKAAEDAEAKAQQAATDLATAKQNLADVTSRVDATEEEVAAAQQAVETAQAAATKAEADAVAAQQTANTAKADAQTAQTVANNAKTAADEAQAAADEAQSAADKAQEAVDALAVRVITAETKITQNAEKIELAATKEEVTKTLGGYYTKTEMDAALTIKADEISSKVSKKIEKTGTASGGVIRVDDVSDVEHDVSVKLSAEPALEDYSTVTLTRCGKNILNAKTIISYNNAKDWVADGECFTIRGNEGAKAYNYDAGQIMLPALSAASKTGFDIKAGVTYAVSFNALILEVGKYSSAIQILIYYSNSSVCNEAYRTITLDTNDRYSFTFTPTKDDKASMCFRVNNNYITISNIQIEEGAATDFIPYIEPTEYTPNADGTIKGMRSISPTMILCTDTAGVNIECEYNKNTIIGDITGQISNAETSIKQNSETIELKATSIDDVNARLMLAESAIKVLSDAIAHMVRKNGDSSVMIQEEDEATWYFDVGNLEENSAANSEAIGALQTETDENKTELEKLKGQVEGYEQRFTVGVYEDEPCIILHETDTDRVQIVTNTRRIFARKVETTNTATGETEVSYTDKVITDYETVRGKKVEVDESVKVGVWAWETRNNGRNFGLVWKGVEG